MISRDAAAERARPGALRCRVAANRHHSSSKSNATCLRRVRRGRLPDVFFATITSMPMTPTRKTTATVIPTIFSARPTPPDEFDEDAEELSAESEPKKGRVPSAGVLLAGVSEGVEVVSGGGLAGGVRPGPVSPDDGVAGVFHGVPEFVPNAPGPAGPLRCAPQCGQMDWPGSVGP